jgi:hypothetical protein
VALRKQLPQRPNACRLCICIAEAAWQAHHYDLRYMGRVPGDFDCAILLDCQPAGHQSSPPPFYFYFAQTTQRLVGVTGGAHAGLFGGYKNCHPLSRCGCWRCLSFTDLAEKQI